MATFLAPPGHPAQPAVLAASSIAGIGVQIDPPDADLKEPVLKTADGATIKGGAAILKHVCQGSSLLPEAAQADVEKWLAAADSIEVNSRAWVEPFASAGDYSDEARAAAQAAISQELQQLEAHLAGKQYVAGDSLTIADVSLASSLQPLFSAVLGAEARQGLTATAAWLKATCEQQQLIKLLGSLSLCSSPASWVVPAPKKDKKKKGKGAEGAAAAANNNGAAAGQEDEELDPEKAAKKAAKLAEKAAKAAKFEAKKAAQAAAAAAKAEAGQDKKANAKAEAEAKKKAEEEEVAKLLAAARATPKGQKKDVSGAMPKAYNPRIVEAAWYEWWEECGFFKPDPKSTKPPFVMVIPPPNVTGALHIGHALTNTIEDLITRWRRMGGYNALWVPGTDHAGIATQTVVEKKLQKERGITRHALGRENFLGEVWQWVEQYGGKICNQLRRMGSSVDWSRQAFTMDDNLSRAVLEAFVRMFEQGIIYRDTRLVNWCCRLKTALSDIEVEYIDLPKRTLMNVPGYDEPVEFGVLTSFAYPLEGGEGEVVVATTRPETMLGDTAIAIHPEDPRYTHLHGKFVIHPVDGRRIPIICDPILVDMAFGTGCVKVTPAHDPNDFLVGKRHSLEFINVFDDNGSINDNGGQFKGQKRFVARVTVVDFLKEKGLFRGTTDNPMRLGICSRSKDVIEPVIKPQWYVNCKDAAAKSVAAVREGQLQIIPKEFEKTWFGWLENIRDWCISRQLWWGHRIPAYYVRFEDEVEGAGGSPGMPSEDMSRWVSGRSREEAEARAAEKYPGRKVVLVQDEDVLDTWFSSGLFPFSVFQWPNQSEDLSAFYPTSLLETGHDILFFWVARMVMMGIMLTGQVPFKQVLLHAMIRDAHGRKMSKSLGNVINPIDVIEGITLEGLNAQLLEGNLDPKEVERARSGQAADFPEGIEECGTDALRFALAAYTSQARDINLDIKRVVGYRYWCNKLWNAIKFAMMNLPEGFVPSDPKTFDLSPSGPFLAPSRWILSRLNGAVAGVTKAMEEYNFATATQLMYSLWQYDVCDVFIELMKPVMAFDDAVPEKAAAKKATRDALWVALETGLRLLHPFMPFVTEELWQRLPKRPEQQSVPSIVVAEYPVVMPGWDNAKLEKDMDFVMSVVNKARKLRNDYGLLKQKPHLYVVVNDADREAVLSSSTLEIATLSSSCEVIVLGAAAGGAAPPPMCGVAIVDDATVVHMLLKGILDPALEIAKLQKKVSEVGGRIEALAKKTALPGYADKTPEAVKADDADKMSKLEGEKATAVAAIADMQKLLDQQA